MKLLVAVMEEHGFIASVENVPGMGKMVITGELRGEFKLSSLHLSGGLWVMKQVGIYKSPKELLDRNPVLLAYDWEYAHRVPVEGIEKCLQMWKRMKEMIIHVWGATFPDILAAIQKTEMTGAEIRDYIVDYLEPCGGPYDTEAMEAFEKLNQEERDGMLKEVFPNDETFGY